MKEKRHRVEDAVSATKAAVEEGVVVGGGKALLNCLGILNELSEQSSGDEKVGIAIFKKAIEEPARVIANNAGVDGSVVVGKLKESGSEIGYNAETDKYENLFESGVIDPAKVVRTVIENAVSVAALFLTTEAVITEEPNPEPTMPPQMP
jgi:chaperonin GroEL